LVVAIGASVSVVALCALALDVLGLPLEAGVWAAVLVALTLLLLAVAARARVRVPRAQARGAVAVRNRRVALPRTVDLVLIALALAAVATSFRLGVTPLEAPESTPGYTALWMTQDGTRLTAVAQSGEMRPARYRMVVRDNGRTLARSRIFRLLPNQEARFSIPAAKVRDKPRVEALLYRADEPRRPYRQVELMQR
jgi:hypothetical protein